MASLSALAALGGLLMTATPASAYQGVQINSTITANITVVPPGGKIHVVVTIKDQFGTVVVNEGVHFHDPGPRPGCDAQFDPVDTVTDANGQAATDVTLPPNKFTPTACPGAYDVFAVTSSGIQLHLILIETGAFPNTGGFPNTTADAPSRPVPASGLPLYIWALVAGGVVVLGGCAAVVLRRRAA